MDNKTLNQKIEAIINDEQLELSQAPASPSKVENLENTPHTPSRIQNVKVEIPIEKKVEEMTMEEKLKFIDKGNSIEEAEKIAIRTAHLAKKSVAKEKGLALNIKAGKDISIKNIGLDYINRVTKKEAVKGKDVIMIAIVIDNDKATDLAQQHLEEKNIVNFLTNELERRLPGGTRVNSISLGEIKPQYNENGKQISSLKNVVGFGKAFTSYANVLHNFNKLSASEIQKKFGNFPYEPDKFTQKQIS